MSNKLSSGFVFPMSFVPQNTASIVDANDFVNGLRSMADDIEAALKEHPYIIVGFYGDNMAFSASDDFSEYPDQGAPLKDLLRRYIEREAQSDELSRPQS